MGALNHPQLVGLLLGFPHWWWLFEHGTPAGSRNLRSESLQEACWLVFSFLLGAYACAWAQVDVWLPDLGAYESYSSYSSGNSSVVHPAATRTLTCFSIQYSVWLVNYNRYALCIWWIFLSVDSVNAFQVDFWLITTTCTWVKPSTDLPCSWPPHYCYCRPFWEAAACCSSSEIGSHESWTRVFFNFQFFDVALELEKRY